MSGYEELGISPKLDYLYGYSVKNVLTKDDDTGFVIEFENGALVSSEVKFPEIPPVEGLALLGAIYSNDETRLRFGIQTLDADGHPNIVRETFVVFEPTNYTITDPRFEQAGTVFPQRAPEEIDRSESIREQFRQQAELGNEPEATESDSEPSADVPRLHETPDELEA